MTRAMIVLVTILFSFPAQAGPAPVNESVYEYDPAVDGAVIGGAALGSLVPALLDTQLIYVPPPVDPNQVNPLDRHVIGNRNVFAGNLSDVTLGLVVAFPAVADLIDLGWSREYAEDMVVYAEVMTVNSALVTLFKYTVQRPLPRVYAGTDPDLARSPGGYRAFYSGHVSSTIAALSAASFTMNARHHSGAWPWLMTLGLGASVAAERVAAGVHFYTDVGVGALMGLAVGTIVPVLHRRDASSSHVALSPAPGGAALTWSAHF